MFSQQHQYTIKTNRLWELIKWSRRTLLKHDVSATTCHYCQMQMKETRTSRHLHLRIDEHRYFVIGKHLKGKHQQEPTNPRERFKILKKCRGKFECLIYEMLFLRKRDQTLTPNPLQQNFSLFILLFFKFNVVFHTFVSYIYRFIVSFISI